jgi:tripartite-type tricarboxylate transporter receptor subunit TctC
VNPLLQKTPYDPERDLIPVAKIGVTPFVLVANPSFPAANSKEFIALVRANPGKYSFASSGTGATAHLICEYFNSRAGLKALHVPYKGSAPALADVIGGQVTYAFETASATMPLVRSGKLKAFGITLGKGSSLTPGIDPLAVSANLPGFDIGAWIGILVPAGTARPIVDRLAEAIKTAMERSEVRDRLFSVGIEVDYRRTEDFARDLREQRANFADIIRKTRITLD